MRAYTPAETALLLIDIQQGFKDPAHWGSSWSTPSFESNIETLLAAFRQYGSPIFHVCHHSRFESSPLHPSKEGSRFMPYTAPLDNEPVFSKTTNSPFEETTLKSAIQAAGVQRLVVVGLTTPHCISTTIRMASNQNVVEHAYGTSYIPDDRRGAIVVVSDATATTDVVFNGKHFDAETVHTVHLATMKDEFCDVESTMDVLRQLRGS